MLLLLLPIFYAAKADDIERATMIARNMITRWGFSKKLAPMQYEKDNEGSAYLGGSSTTMVSMSDKTAAIIDEEVTEIINSCYAKAKELLEANKDVLENMKDALLKYETIDADQIDDLMNRREVRAPSKPSKDEKKKDDEKSSSDNKEDNSEKSKSVDAEVKDAEKSNDTASDKETASPQDVSSDNDGSNKDDKE